MGMKIAEFFVALGVDVENKDSKKLNDVVKGMANLDVKSIAAAAGLGVAFVALKKITEQAIKTGLALHNFSVQTGISTRKLQQWSFVAEQMGASAADVESAVKSLQISTAQIKLGQGNLAPFQMLGVNPLQNEFDLLEDIAEKIKGLDPGMTRLISSQLGISDGMLNILKSSKDVRGEIEKQFFLREKEINQLNDLRKVWVRLRQGIFFFMNVVVVQLVPVFQNLTKFVTDVKDGFLKLIGGVENLKWVIPGLVAVFAPFQAILALIIFLIDDFYASMSGGGSVFDPTFNRIADWWLKIELAIHGANNALRGFKDNLLLKNLPSMTHILSGAIPQFKLGGGSSKKEIKIDVTVNGANEPRNTAEEVRRALRESFSSSAYETPIGAR